MLGFLFFLVKWVFIFIILGIPKILVIKITIDGTDCIVEMINASLTVVN